jgi:hypothetical protein
MRNLRLISTTAAILLLGAGAVSAQSMKADETPAAAPAAQQNAPAENVAPAPKSGQHKVPETTGQATPTAPEADKKQLKGQAMDRPQGAATPKSSSDSNGNANVKNSAAENGVGAASSSRKSTDESKRSTTGQGAANEGVVDPAPVRHRHHRHYRNCLPNIFDHGNCWR